MLPRSVQNRQPFQDNVATLTKVAHLERSKFVCIPQKKESSTKICSPCTKNNMHQLKSHPSPRKTVSRFPPKGSTDFLENLEGDPPKIINFPTHFQTILLDPMAPPGSLIHLLISTGEISRKSLVYFLDTNGLQAPKADLVFGKKCV